jgi:multiple sugar transport system substrate-binding protein
MYSVTSWGLAIAAGSKKKDAAWEFVKWATSKDTTIKTQSVGSVPSARSSVWESPEGAAKFSADWIAAAKASAAGKSYDRPLVVQVGKARDIIGSAIVAAIEGKNVEAAARDANQQFQALLSSEPK